MKMKNILVKFSPLLFLIFTFCSSPEDKKKIIKLTEEVESLIAENEELREYLKEFEAEKAQAIESEKQRLEKLRKTSQGLAYNDKIQVITVMTGFDPYHNRDNLWLPTIALMFKNISNANITDYVEVRAVFINNSNGEQLAEDFEYLCTGTRPFSKDTKKQISLNSSIGWYAVQSQNISVKISIDKSPFKTYKIKNREFSGRIQ